MTGRSRLGATRLQRSVRSDTVPVDIPLGRGLSPSLWVEGGGGTGAGVGVVRTTYTCGVVAVSV